MDACVAQIIEQVGGVIAENSDANGESSAISMFEQTTLPRPASPRRLRAPLDRILHLMKMPKRLTQKAHHLHSSYLSARASRFYSANYCSWGFRFWSSSGSTSRCSLAALITLSINRRCNHSSVLSREGGGGSVRDLLT
jgi:hypothetical protein